MTNNLSISMRVREQTRETERHDVFSEIMSIVKKSFKLTGCPNYHWLITYFVMVMAKWLTSAMWPVLILQPRPVNHVLLTTPVCFLGFWNRDLQCLNFYQNKTIINLLIRKYTHHVHILDEKTLQIVLSIGWHLISSKTSYCYVLPLFLKKYRKCS